MHEYDKSSKWLIEHHGNAILWFAGIRDVAEWRVMQAELVQPRFHPDAFLEARRAGQDKPSAYILEMATYAEPRVADQAVRDASLVYLDRGILPEVLVVILSRRRPRRPAHAADLRSEQGWTRLQMTWRTIELWKLPAEELLEAGDVGLIPWGPLCHFDGPPARFFASAGSGSTATRSRRSVRTCWSSRKSSPACDTLTRGSSSCSGDEKP